MGEKGIAAPALIRLVHEYGFYLDRYDGNGRLAGEHALRALSRPEHEELLQFCRTWLAIPVPPQHSGRIRMGGLGSFAINQADLGRIRDAIVAFRR